MGYSYANIFWIVALAFPSVNNLPSPLGCSSPLCFHLPLWSGVIHLSAMAMRAIPLDRCPTSSGQFQTVSSLALALLEAFACVHSHLGWLAKCWGAAGHPVLHAAPAPSLPPLRHTGCHTAMVMGAQEEGGENCRNRSAVSGVADLCKEQQLQAACVVNSGSPNPALQIKDAWCLFINPCRARIFVFRMPSTRTLKTGLWLQVLLLEHWLLAVGSKAGEMQHFLSNCCAGLEKLAQACHRAEALRGGEDWQV